MTNVGNELAYYRAMRDRLLERHPELAEDEDYLFDTLEGCTNLNETLVALFESSRADDDRAAAIDARIADLKDRKERFCARSDSKRRIIADAMAEAGLKKLEAPEVTLSLRAVAPSVVITDEAALPDWAWKETIKRAPDKTTIKAKIADGLHCPGAQLSNGGQTLSARVK